MTRQEFFKRFQTHDKLKHAEEPERTQWMKTMWRLWTNPTAREGKGAAVLLGR